MTESEFATLSEAVLDHIEDAIERSGATIDVERKGAGIVEIDIDGFGSIVVNSQAPMRQIWLASRAGAHHFEFRDGAWRDTRGDASLHAVLERLIREHGGTKVRFD
ncbi:MAG: iron donor protein CyaY [Burkholderiales bacterium]|nr:iron donor protein CyaY [Burkholderiales bacterium]